MNVTFEKAVVQDAEALTDVQTRCFDDDSRRFAGQERGGPPGYDSVVWQRQMIRQATAYYKIMDGSRIIGGIILFNKGNSHFELGRIYLDPDYQDQGIGTGAIAFIERSYPAVRKWSLDTPGWAVRNHHFYEKLGYEKVRESQEWGVTLCFYEKHSATEN